MLQIRIEASLNQIEQQVTLAHVALIGGDPHKMEFSTTTLQQMSVELHGLIGEFHYSGNSTMQFKLRLMALSEAIALLREGLSRRNGLIDRTLHCLLPKAHPQTYSQLSSQYGSVGRQSGVFRIFAI